MVSSSLAEEVTRFCSKNRGSQIEDNRTEGLIGDVFEARAPSARMRLLAAGPLWELGFPRGGCWSEIASMGWTLSLQASLRLGLAWAQLVITVHQSEARARRGKHFC